MVRRELGALVIAGYVLAAWVVLSVLVGLGAGSVMTSVRGIDAESSSPGARVAQIRDAPGHATALS
jgi:hypothetical protein